MHASLAQLTPELLALDDLIHGQCPSILPAELLLLIRTFLLPLITAQLISQSEKSLEAHERSMLSLLCRDCIAYNIDIYGPSAFRWPWDQFSGPCACRANSIQHRTRIENFNHLVTALRSPTCLENTFDSKQDDASQLNGDPLQFSPDFLSADYILEFQLSRQARKLARLAFKANLSLHREKHQSRIATAPNLAATSPRFDARSVTSIFLRVKTIWDLISIVLREKYGCEVLEVDSQNPSTDADWNESWCSSMEHAHGDDSIMELHPLPSFSHADPSEEPEASSGVQPGESHSATAGNIATSSEPTDSQSSSLSAFWSISSPSNKRDRVYVAPLHQGSAVTQPLGFRHISTSFDERVNLPSSSCASSSEETAVEPADPWVSRALLVHTKRDLGFDLDYSQYCTTLKARSKNPNGLGSAESGELQQPSDTEVGNEVRDDDSDSCSTSGAATEAPASTPSLFPMMSMTAGPHAHWMGSAPFATPTLVEFAQTFLQSCGSTNGCCPPHQHGVLSSSSPDPQCHHRHPSPGSSHPLAPLSPSRLLNGVLGFCLSSATFLGYLIRFTGVLITLCISLPLTVARVALTVVCFYYRPASFRLL
ncbi:hypothetical protein FA15DRAFT_258556 [Coprinopsis marcescibilis]|uniref:Uncharacterized protein n=1 Tax=Coprinopsis marcescibilis TaxID=230819 RepID=A0A5C3L2J7_COPMA|nr:hypothetical protein FA15DRAFT_258556 [Coprinopsis marcescibilis]